jgi:glutaminyl-tRNA synthetase
VEENLKLFTAMRDGQIAEGKMVLRAKIDMNSPNVNMRDPVIYRIKKVPHQRTGDKWVIYPMYDYTHCISDALEGITHSLCSLEFEDHRPLYDWILDQLNVPCHPRQIEFARLSLNFTVMSKRKLLQLVEEKLVSGWDDPRMPTISGMRRRGYPASAIRQFTERIGIGKKNTVISFSILEDCVRDELNRSAFRLFGVVEPLLVTITNYEKQNEFFSCANHPQDESQGKRQVPFSKQIYIEKTDFMEIPPKKYHRLYPGSEVRLRYGYVIKCQEVIKNPAGEVIELKCTHDPESLGGKTSDGRAVKGIIHWVSAQHALDAQVRVYDRLFKHPNPDGTDFLQHINPDSMTIQNAKVEPIVAEFLSSQPETAFQFERVGYFVHDQSSTRNKMILNRTVTLRDGWAKIEQDHSEVKS